MQHLKQQPNRLIRIRPATRDKLQSVCDVKGWKMTEAIERAINTLIRSDKELARINRVKPAA